MTTRTIRNINRSPLQEKLQNNQRKTRMADKHQLLQQTASTDQQQQQLGRPTEAQLRWAQFERKRRAQETHDKVQRLYQFPANVKDVQDALSEDGNSSTASESSFAKYRKSEKPKISRGRRALLRVSKRKYETRHERILERGYSRYAEDEVDKENEEEERADVVSAMFDSPARRKKRESTGLGNSRRRRQSRALSRDVQEEESRIRRFEAAHAMMMSLRDKEKNKQQPIIKSTKRWTRPTNQMAVSIDGRSYEAWKWGLTRRQTRRKAKTKASRSDHPFDRRASWLVHLPARESSSRRQTFEPALGPDGEPLEPNVSLYDLAAEGFLSPGQIKFDELVRLVQSREHSFPTAVAPDAPHRGAGLSQYEDHLRKLYEAEQQAMLSPSAAKRRPRMSLFGEEEEEKKEIDVDASSPRRILRQGYLQGDGIERSFEADNAEENGEFHQKDSVTYGMKKEQLSGTDRSSRTRLSSGGSDEIAETRPDARTPVRGLREDPAMDAIPETEVAHGSPARRSTISQRNVLTGGDDASVNSSTSFRFGKRVGGLFNMVTGTRSDDGSLNAIAMFRKTRNEREDDGTNSTSTFQLLPEGIRRVVKGFSTGRSNEEDIEVTLNEDGDAASAVILQQQSFVSDLHHSEFHGVDPPLSPDRSSVNSGIMSVSPEHSRLLSQRVLQNGVDPEQDIIDTDDTRSDGSSVKMDPKTAAALMLSPTILTKRHQQAIRAVEKREWDHVLYLIHANPWLAEMMEVTTEQYLLHKLALFGAGEVEIDDETGEIKRVVSPMAPSDLNEDLIKMFPASIHKFDKDGNLPLHMAAASGNVPMVELLGEKFPSGASVRNEDGMLPLHLGIQACVNPTLDKDGDLRYPSDFIASLVKLFPGAVAITDNDGDLPIHIAATNLNGDEGVDVIYVLLDEADRQVHSEAGVRFSDVCKVKSVDEDAKSTITDITANSSNTDEEILHCNMVRNDIGRTALTMAIHSLSGWEVIEALVSGPGGRQAALLPNADKNNALHLLLSEECVDPAAALSILKVAPDAASIRNGAGVLPIEMASMRVLPNELILAIALLDLPIDLSEKEGVKVRDGFGDSWWFLNCECDDHHIPIVEEVISICTYHQLRELCFMNRSGVPVMSRATPLCRSALRKALRFVGRFEFLGSEAIMSDKERNVSIFEALDFGTDENPIEEGKKVLLRCYEEEAPFLEDSMLLKNFHLDFSSIEYMYDLVVQEHTDASADTSPQQFCLATDTPGLTLDRVVDGMQKNEELKRSEEMRSRYFSKVCAVLRSVAKSLRHLHELGLVHGDVCLEHCGRFGDKWKLTSMIGTRRLGQRFPISRLSEASPPESVLVLSEVTCAFADDLIADPSVDIWSFGKLVYEAFTGDGLIGFDPELEMKEDNKALQELAYWNDTSLKGIGDSLRHSGVSSLGVDLVTHCLQPDPNNRPENMDVILNHAFWKDLRRKSAVVSRPSSTRNEM